jgi:hypothetical protein
MIFTVVVLYKPDLGVLKRIKILSKSSDYVFVVLNQKDLFGEIKLDIENLQRKDNEEYQHDIKAVRRVQLYCFAVAAVIAWYLTWGIKG